MVSHSLQEQRVFLDASDCPLVSVHQEANSAARNMPCYAAWKSDVQPQHQTNPAEVGLSLPRAQRMKTDLNCWDFPFMHVYIYTVWFVRL